MKKAIVCLTLVVLMLLPSFALAAEIFPDVPIEHWAFSYIDNMRETNIINGYPDGTYQPEKLVTNAEFFKMACMVLYDNYKYPELKEGEHWARPYANSLLIISKDYTKYNDTMLDYYISRQQAAAIIADMYVKLQGRKGNIVAEDPEHPFIKTYSDEAQITTTTRRNAVDLCSQYGLINGFEDGTFRPKEGLTRAQAAKLLTLVQE